MNSVFRQMIRLFAALAIALVSADAFAQAPRNNLLNRNLNRRVAPQNQGSRMGVPNRTGMANRPVPNPPGMGGAVTPAAGAAGAGAGADAAKPEGEHALNWDAAPLDIVLQAYAAELDKTYLKDPAVPNATITLKSREGQKMTKEEYLEAIEVILEMNGIHLEPYGEKFIRVLPRKEVRKEGIPLIMDATKRLEESGKVVSMMIPFKNIGTEEAQKALEGFKSNSGILLVFERTNSILVTDTQQNINRMLEIAKTIDIATPVLENVFVRQIKHASAADIKTALEAIVQDSQKELEKNKGAQNVRPAQPQFPTRPLLRGQQQPQQPANNASLVMSVSDADRGMIRGKVLILSDERSNKLVIITQKTNMDFFDRVIEQLDVETTPDTVVKVYRLKYADAEEVSDMINDLIGNAGGKSGGKDNQNRNAKNGTGGNVTRSNTAVNAPRKSANQRSGEAKAGELTKDNTTVLADKRINGLVVMTEKDLVPTLEQIIESMDVKLSQVLIETVIIEVTLGDELATGMDWIQHGRQNVTVPSKTSTGIPTYYTKRETTYTDGSGTQTSTSYLTDLVPSGYSKSSTTSGTTASGDTWTKTVTDSASSFAGSASQIATDGVLNYYTAGTATAIGGGQGGQLAHEIASGITSNVFGKALNFVFTSDELGISAILQATKTDSRSKYIASPVIMTLDNKEATINATSMRYLLKGFTSSGNSYSTIAVPDYEQKELGIEIKATPKINPNGTVMLEVEEKYTQLGNYQTIQYATGGNGTDSKLQDVPVPTTITREMSSDVLLESNQTVVFAGLTETTKSSSETGIPILKDIPWIGKWLFSKVEDNEYRTELLIFMTPYVLNDAEAAQAEALRRKKTMSDPRPWEDRGWSLSELADPVDKKEQMRRLKDEWKKQDEERGSKLEIEKAKIDRAKELKKMGEEERKLWLEMHKKELEDEKKEAELKELKEKMLDKESQDELKDLAKKVRERKLAEADKADKANAEAYAGQNERARLDDEKAAAEKKKEDPKPEPEKKPGVEEVKLDKETQKALAEVIKEKRAEEENHD